jgi:prepilin-type N-terminal cleavage/methylation domain-containing protein
MAIHNPITASGSPRAVTRPRGMLPGFTLIELLITISIIGILAGTLLFALSGAAETAKESKTKALIAKLNNLIMPRWESYRTRRVPVSTLGLQPAVAAQPRLDAIHDLMRMELPDRWIDVTDPPAALAFPGTSNTATIPAPAVYQAYQRAYYANVNRTNPPPPSPTAVVTYQGAECLYLIVTLGITDELGGRELFNESNIGDVDNDGFKEFLDGWGMPIRFVRWPAGFGSELGSQASGVVTSGSSSSITATGSFSANPSAYKNTTIVFASGTLIGQQAAVSDSSYTAGTPPTTTLSVSATGSPSAGDLFYVMAADPFDPRHVYPNSASGSLGVPQSNPTFATYPLIFSGGANKIYGIVYNLSDSSGNALHTTTDMGNYPCYVGSGPPPLSMGSPNNNSDEQGTPNYEPSGWLDNIHNHLIGTR